MFYTEEEVSVITGLLNAYLVREHASEKVRESYTRISEGLQSRVLTRDDYVWLENALLFLRPYWWNDREDGRMLMDALLHTQTLSGIIDAPIRSAGSTSKASAISKNTSSVKLCAVPGASMTLRSERLIPAFSASFSCDIPRSLRRVTMAMPIWIKRSLFLNETVLLMRNVLAFRGMGKLYCFSTPLSV